MNELSRAVGHLDWLASSRKRASASQALATYNTANRIRLCTFDENAVSHVPVKAIRQLRNHADHVSTAALQVLSMDTCPATKQKATDPYSVLGIAIQKLLRCATRYGLGYGAHEWQPAAKSPSLQEIVKAATSQESIKRSRDAKARKYDERVAAVCAMLFSGLAADKDHALSKASRDSLIQVGAGILRSAHRDTGTESTHKDLVHHNRLAADILLSTTKAGPSE